ncbi:MAG: fused MFS/spermidine synthase [Alphaproteobacteria bacterium]|nr:fused MFS/spermidine synthase [Alphaproteobacteria bacterium]
MMLPAGAILLSAFLLFLVQPLMGRLITPWFGGSASVWTTCLVFFQGALVVGYGYAALSIRLLSPKWQRLLHLILLAASLLALPMLPDANWKPADPHHALIQIGGLLLASVGAPYMLLAATGPLVQSWHAGGGHVPWRLYAFSNLASIAALLAYPFAIEPWFALHTQALAWSAFYLLAALLILALAWRTRRQLQPAPDSTAIPPKRADIATWAILAALPTALLVATTEYLTRDVAPLPLLWIPPLALYLLSFVVWFDGRMRFHRLFWMLAATVFIVVMARVMTMVRFRFEPTVLAPLFLAGLFVVCLYCHGELAQRRPEPRRLGSYYFALSLGGALGGLMVAVAAPLLLTAHYDMAILLAATSVPLALGAFAFARPLFKGAVLVCTGLALAAGLYGVRHVYRVDRDILVSQQRSFYGTLHVVEEDIGKPDHRRELMHGIILHGLQYMAPERRREPTEYYRPQSAVGLAVATLPERPRRIAVIGLGAGTIAAYGRPGDTIVFYEIDPAIERIARRDFTFLAESDAEIEVVLGDARLSLEREPSRNYDLLVLDAFSGNAPPLHLLTVEAFGIYIRHLATDGLIAVQVSHKFLTFDPFVLAAAVAHGWTGGLATDRMTSEWIVATRDRARLAQAPLGEALKPLDTTGIRPWTDDFIDILRALRDGSDSEAGSDGVSGQAERPRDAVERP